MDLVAGSSDVTLNLTATDNAVKLWWPNGLGPQTMYTVNVTFVPSGGPPVTVLRRIGFRVFVLVSANDTDVENLTGQVSLFLTLCVYRSVCLSRSVSLSQRLLD